MIHMHAQRQGQGTIIQHAWLSEKTILVTHSIIYTLTLHAGCNFLTRATDTIIIHPPFLVQIPGIRKQHKCAQANRTEDTLGHRILAGGRLFSPSGNVQILVVVIITVPSHRQNNKEYGVCTIDSQFYAYQAHAKQIMHVQQATAMHGTIISGTNIAVN